MDTFGVQVTLTEVRSDGIEVYIQSGWLDFGHRTAEVGENLRLVRSFAQAECQAVPVDEWVSGRVAIPSFAHPFREGSALRISISTPGRDHGTWEFDNPEYDVAQYSNWHERQWHQNLSLGVLHWYRWKGIILRALLCEGSLVAPMCLLPMMRCNNTGGERLI